MKEYNNLNKFLESRNENSYVIPTEDAGGNIIMYTDMCNMDSIKITDKN